VWRLAKPYYYLFLRGSLAVGLFRAIDFGFTLVLVVLFLDLLAPAFLEAPAFEAELRAFVLLAAFLEEDLAELPPFSDLIDSLR